MRKMNAPHTLGVKRPDAGASSAGPSVREDGPPLIYARRPFAIAAILAMKHGGYLHPMNDKARHDGRAICSPLQSIHDDAAVRR